MNINRRASSVLERFYRPSSLRTGVTPRLSQKNVYQQLRLGSWQKKTIKKLSRMKDRFIYAASFNGPRVSIVGRPNVGKSFLFNRFCHRNIAIVDETPGVTRDRKIGQGSIADLEFSVVDTPGYEELPLSTLDDKWEMHKQMLQQIEIALDSSDVILLLTDVKTGITENDRCITKYIRKWLDEHPEKNIQVCLVANKCEAHSDVEQIVAEHLELGMGEPTLISAMQREGWVDLFHTLDDAFHVIERNLAPVPMEGELDSMLRLAIVGRPNVGKSTLINKLLKENRVIAGDVPRLTRDSVSTTLYHEELHAHFQLVDTAGMVGLAKKAKRERLHTKPENLAIEDSLKALKYSNVVVVMVDVSKAVLGAVNHKFVDDEAFETTESDAAIHAAKCIVRSRDKQLVRFCLEEGKCVMLVLNKWDLLPKEYQKRQVVIGVQKYLPTLLRDYGMIPHMSTSALFDENIDQILPTALKLYRKWQERVQSSKLNQFLGEAQRLRPGPHKKTRQLRVRFAIQHSIRPPAFTFFCGSAGLIPETYLRYLRNAIRDEYDFAGIPIRITCRCNVTENPFKSKTPGYGEKDFQRKQILEANQIAKREMREAKSELSMLQRRGQVDEHGRPTEPPISDIPDKDDENDLRTGWAGYSGKVYRRPKKAAQKVLKHTSTG